MQAANALPAKPAAFDQSSQYRRAMTAKINIAWRQIGMCEDDYRQLLLETTGKLYLKECSDGDLIMVIDRLKAKGFKPIPRKKVAMHPFAQKARAMWKSLYYLGAVHSPSEEALEAFAKRQLKCERLVWARQSDSEKVMEVRLRSMGEREGWLQHCRVTQKRLKPLTLKSSLCQVILGKRKRLASPQQTGISPRPCGVCADRERPRTRMVT
jgi:hypothetical protein